MPTTIEDPVLGTLKQCGRCSEWWPYDLEFFYRDSTKPDGFHAWCKACNLEAKEITRRAQGAMPMSEGGRYAR